MKEERKEREARNIKMYCPAFMIHPQLPAYRNPASRILQKLETSLMKKTYEGEKGRSKCRDHQTSNRFRLHPFSDSHYQKGTEYQRCKAIKRAKGKETHENEK